MNHFYKTISSPLGMLTIIAHDTALVAITWMNEGMGEGVSKKKFPNAILKNNHPILLETTKELDEYFKGTRTNFTIQLDPAGTDFQKAAWNFLRSIPYGETRSYTEQATAIGNKKACRAVGGANGANPIPIIIPCHRVIGQNGKLTGFAAGVDVKEKLLYLENKKIQKAA